MTAVVTAVTTTAVSGIGICISMTGIFSVGCVGVSVFSSSSVLTPSGASRSLGGMIIGLYDGTSALGCLRGIVGSSNGFGRLGAGSSILPGYSTSSCWCFLFS